MKTRALSLTLGLLAVVYAGTLPAQDAIAASDCAICHEDSAAAFQAGEHGRAMVLRSEEIVESSCEACHGSATAHIENPSPDNIVRWPDDSACVSCHADARTKTELMSPAHNRHGVPCLDCHDSGHGDSEAQSMLLDVPRRLCAECHRIEAGSFRLPYAHRDGSEPFDCTTCHAVHGDTRVGRLNLLSSGGACLDCHIEKTRPFVYPHPPVDRPGCVACHLPHGSPNPRMLTRRNIDLLCLECHTGVPAFHDVSSNRYRNCQTCHAAVHGSNRDPRLIEE